MKATESNFEKIRSVTVREWSLLTPYKKSTYWKMHKEYPDEHLLDYIESELNLDDKKVKQESSKSNSNRIKYEEIKKAEIQKREKAQEKIAKLKNNLFIKDEEISYLNDYIEKIESKVSEMKKQVKDVKKKFTEYQLESGNRMKKLEHELIDLKIQTEKGMEKLKEKNLEIKKDTKFLKKEFKGQDKINIKLVTDNEQLKSTVNEMNKSLLENKKSSDRMFLDFQSVLANESSIMLKISNRVDILEKNH
jgi:SMC interacting uncharacterized protein involved in chromosome segregation